MQPTIPILLLLAVTATSTITDNANTNESLPAYNDSLQNYTLKNTSNIPPPSYQEAIVRDYLYDNQVEEMERGTVNQPITQEVYYYRLENANIKYFKYLRNVVITVGTIVLCLVIIRFILWRYLG